MIERSALKIDAKSLSDLNDMIERAKNTHIANGWLLVNVSRTVIDGYSAVVQLIRRVEARKEPVDDADARLEFVADAILALIEEPQHTEYERKVAQMKEDFPNGI